MINLNLELKDHREEGGKQMIKIVGDYDYNMSQVLKQVVAQIQDKFDLDPQIVVGAWLGESGFQEMFEEKTKEVYRKHLKHSKLSGLLEELLNVNNPDEFVETRMDKEFEKCGYILDSSSNGYIKYCNCHKYAHQTKYNLKAMREEWIDEDKDKGGPEKDCVIRRQKDIEHFFVRKTSTQILEEAVFRLKFNIFLGFTQKLVKKMVGCFVEWIRERYRVGFVPQEDWEVLGQFLAQHKVGQTHHKRGIFRSKIAFMDRIGNSYCKIYIDHGIGVNGFKVLDSLS